MTYDSENMFYSDQKKYMLLSQIILKKLNEFSHLCLIEAFNKLYHLYYGL